MKPLLSDDPIVPGVMVPVGDPDEEFNEQLASDYRRAQEMTNTRLWLEGDEVRQAEHLETQLAEFSPMFWLVARFWIVVLIAILFMLWYQHSHRGHPMPNPEHEKPVAPASAPGEPHGSTLHAAINRFAQALITAGTHPDTGMFFFDAQDLTVNGKLETLKMRALVDTLDAVLPHAIRARFEKRLEELVLLSAQQLEEGARRIALTARVPPGGNGGVNGSGHG
jgi:hypothetical protein